MFLLLIILTWTMVCQEIWLTECLGLDLHGMSWHIIVSERNYVIEEWQAHNPSHIPELSQAELSHRPRSERMTIWSHCIWRRVVTQHHWERANAYTHTNFETASSVLPWLTMFVVIMLFSKFQCCHSNFSYLAFSSLLHINVLKSFETRWASSFLCPHRIRRSYPLTEPN